MEAIRQKSDRPFEFITIYGITLLLVLAGTFLWKLNPGAGPAAPAARAEAEFFASETHETARPVLSLHVLREFWQQKLASF